MFKPMRTIISHGDIFQAMAETIIDNGDFTYGYWSQLIDHMLDHGYVMREMFSFVDTKSVMITFTKI